MNEALFDSVIRSYLQILPAMNKCLDKGRDHLLAEGRSLDSIVTTRLYEDMEPFHFQIVCMMHQCAGAVEGLRSGTFSPPSRELVYDYDGLQSLIQDGIKCIEAVSLDEFRSLCDGEITFTGRSFTLKFSCADFLLTFSLPNFYFHATTTYDMLRIQGVPIGKLDFLGKMRFIE